MIAYVFSGISCCSNSHMKPHFAAGFYTRHCVSSVRGRYYFLLTVSCILCHFLIFLEVYIKILYCCSTVQFNTCYTLRTCSSNMLLVYSLICYLIGNCNFSFYYSVRKRFEPVHPVHYYLPTPFLFILSADSWTTQYHFWSIVNSGNWRDISGTVGPLTLRTKADGS
jgi:hypothetical protein